MDMQRNDAATNSDQGPILRALAKRNDLEETHESNGVKNRRKTLSFVSRIKNITSEYCSLALGAVALELVIMFSFSSHDGLFLILPTLAIGTSVFILDGRKK